MSLLSRPTRATSSRSSSRHESDQTVGAAASSTKATGFTTPNKQDIDAVVASVTGDGVITAVPIENAEGIAAGQTEEVVTLPEGMLERKSSIRTERRRTKFIECLSEEVVQMGGFRWRKGIQESSSFVAYALFPSFQTSYELWRGLGCQMR